MNTLTDSEKNYLESSPLFLFPAMAIQVSRGSGTSCHSHTAAQIVLTLSGKLKVRTLSKASYSICNAVIIPPNVNHHIISSGSVEVMIWFDPATIQARAIRLQSPLKLISLLTLRI